MTRRVAVSQIRQLRYSPASLFLHPLDNKNARVQKSFGAVRNAVGLPGRELVSRLAHALVPARIRQFGNDLLNRGLLVLLLDEGLHRGCRSGIGVRVHGSLREGLPRRSVSGLRIVV